MEAIAVCKHDMAVMLKEENARINEIIRCAPKGKEIRMKIRYWCIDCEKNVEVYKIIKKR